MRVRGPTIATFLAEAEESLALLSSQLKKSHSETRLGAPSALNRNERRRQQLASLSPAQSPNASPARGFRAELVSPPTQREAPPVGGTASPPAKPAEISSNFMDELLEREEDVKEQLAVQAKTLLRVDRRLQALEARPQEPSPEHGKESRQPQSQWAPPLRPQRSAEDAQQASPREFFDVQFQRLQAETRRHVEDLGKSISQWLADTESGLHMAWEQRLAEGPPAEGVTRVHQSTNTEELAAPLDVAQPVQAAKEEPLARDVLPPPEEPKPELPVAQLPLAEPRASDAEVLATVAPVQGGCPADEAVAAREQEAGPQAPLTAEVPVDSTGESRAAVDSEIPVEHDASPSAGAAEQTVEEKEDTPKSAEQQPQPEAAAQEPQSAEEPKAKPRSVQIGVQDPNALKPASPGRCSPAVPIVKRRNFESLFGPLQNAEQTQGSPLCTGTPRSETMENLRRGFEGLSGAWTPSSSSMGRMDSARFKDFTVPLASPRAAAGLGSSEPLAAAPPGNEGSLPEERVVLRDHDQPGSSSGSPPVLARDLDPFSSAAQALRKELGSLQGSPREAATEAHGHPLLPEEEEAHAASALSPAMETTPTHTTDSSTPAHSAHDADLLSPVAPIVQADTPDHSLAHDPFASAVQVLADNDSSSACSYGSASPGPAPEPAEQRDLAADVGGLASVPQRDLDESSVRSSEGNPFVEATGDASSAASPAAKARSPAAAFTPTGFNGMDGSPRDLSISADDTIARPVHAVDVFTAASPALSRLVHECQEEDDVEGLASGKSGKSGRPGHEEGSLGAATTADARTAHAVDVFTAANPALARLVHDCQEADDAGAVAPGEFGISLHDDETAYARPTQAVDLFTAASPALSRLVHGGVESEEGVHPHPEHEQDAGAMRPATAADVFLAARPGLSRPVHDQATHDRPREAQLTEDGSSWQNSRPTTAADVFTSASPLARLVHGQAGVSESASPGLDDDGFTSCRATSPSHDQGCNQEAGRPLSAADVFTAANPVLARLVHQSDDSTAPVGPFDEPLKQEDPGRPTSAVDVFTAANPALARMVHEHDGAVAPHSPRPPHEHQDPNGLTTARPAGAADDMAALNPTLPVSDVEDSPVQDRVSPVVGCPVVWTTSAEDDELDQSRNSENPSSSAHSGPVVADGPSRPGSPVMPFDGSSLARFPAASEDDMESISKSIGNTASPWDALAQAVSSRNSGSDSARSPAGNFRGDDSGSSRIDTRRESGNEDCLQPDNGHKQTFSFSGLQAPAAASRESQGQQVTQDSSRMQATSSSPAPSPFMERRSALDSSMTSESSASPVAQQRGSWDVIQPEMPPPSTNSAPVEEVQTPVQSAPGAAVTSVDQFVPTSPSSSSSGDSSGCGDEEKYASPRASESSSNCAFSQAAHPEQPQDSRDGAVRSEAGPAELASLHADGIDAIEIHSMSSAD